MLINHIVCIVTWNPEHLTATAEIHPAQASGEISSKLAGMEKELSYSITRANL